jgi:hypothetical protein
MSRHYLYTIDAWLVDDFIANIVPASALMIAVMISGFVPLRASHSRLVSAHTEPSSC